MDGALQGGKMKMMRWIPAVLLSVVSLTLAAEDGMWASRKFGPQLVNAAGRKVDAAALKGKMVGVYFSASWCGPCRGFTPKLVEFYNQCARRSDLEIVFVSCDKDAAAMSKYMKDDRMPWLAVPFGSPVGAALQKELHVGGIPKLAIFDASGKVLSDNARWDVVMLGPKAAERWKSPGYKPLTYQDYRESNNRDAGPVTADAGKFGAYLVNAAGRKVDAASALKGKMVGVYFSASWCGPCRRFTPKLVEFYNQCARRSDLEIVFVSSDKEAAAMSKYMKDDRMPWLAIPFGSPAAAALKRELRVNGIPTLVIFDASGRKISGDARWDVTMLGTRAVERWKSPGYKPLTYQDYQASAQKENGSGTAAPSKKKKSKSSSRKKNK